MIKIASLPIIAGALLACGLSAAPTQAGPNRTWVSGMGTDSGACTRAAPCRTFAFALTQTAAGGEIYVLDPAGYGTVAVTKAVSIVNDGVGVAAIVASSGNAITINAGANDSVHLRGLTIEGGSGSYGILFNNGGNLAIENCVIRNFADGIIITPSGSSSFSVSNTIASNNDFGIDIRSNGVVKGVLSNVTTNNNKSAGVFIDASISKLNLTIADSVSSNNKSGIWLFSGSGATVMVRNSIAANNFIGVNSFAGSLYLARSNVTGNDTGVQPSGGAIFSYGDNDINGNNNDNTGGLTLVAMH
jgi:hypothetical protein